MAPKRLPDDIVYQICDAVASNDERFDSRYHFQSLDLVPTSRRGSKSELANLRLVSKVACKAATPHLFRDFDATIPTDGSQSAESWRACLLRFSEGPCAKYVQTLRVGTDHRYMGLESGLVQKRDLSLVAAAYAVPVVARACTSLRAVGFRLDAAGMLSLANGQASWQRSLLLNLVEHTLRECSTTVKSLEVAMPLTYDFESLLEPISQTPALTELMSGLTSLSLTITDFTGHGGTRYWTRPASDGQTRFPNQQHQGPMWRYFQFAPAVSAIAVHATHVLDFDQCSITGQIPLQELDLANVSLSADKVSAMARNSLDTLRAIVLRGVELYAGTWSEVLDTFCELRELINFEIDSCTYALTGSSAHFHPGMWPEPDRPQALNTLHRGDYDALGMLQWHVNGLRAHKGLELYSEHEYRFMGLFFIGDAIVRYFD